jgi:hypothetical protein
MNNHDLGNLNFLLNAGPEELAAWWNNVSTDDRQYASEILNQYSEELKVRQRFIDVESIALPEYMLPDAKQYLKKFTLGKK